MSSSMFIKELRLWHQTLHILCRVRHAFNIWVRAWICVCVFLFSWSSIQWVLPPRWRQLLNQRWKKLLLHYQ